MGARRRRWWGVLVILSLSLGAQGMEAANVGVNQPAEDTAHTTGDEGIQVFAVRNDAGGTLVSASGDYNSLTTDANGNLRVVEGRYSGQSYVAYVASAAGGSKDQLNVFNASGSGKVLRISSINISTANTAAVSAAMLYFTIDKSSTAGATCTAVTIRLVDSNNAAVPAQVTAGTNCTTDPTSSFTYSACSVYGDEASSEPRFATLNCYHAEGQPITLREGEGIAIKQTAIAGAGTVGFQIIFEM